MPDLHPLKRSNTPAGRVKQGVKTPLFLALSIVLVFFMADNILALDCVEDKTYRFSYSWANIDPNYMITDTSITYDTDKLVIEATLNTNYSGHTPSNTYFGLSAGVNLAGIARIYTWDDGWIDRTGVMDYLAQRNIGGKTYDDIYYYSFNTLPDFWEKRIRVEVTATRQQIRNWIQSDNNLIVYFGEATSVLNISEGIDGPTTRKIISDNYTISLDISGAYLGRYKSTFYGQLWGGGDRWSSLSTSAGTQVGNGISDCKFQNDTKEITDVKIIMKATKCGANDYKRDWFFTPDYLYLNETTATTSTMVRTESAGKSFVAAINSSGVQSHSGKSFMNVTQNWAVFYDITGEEGACFTWTNDSNANNTNSIQLAKTSTNLLDIGNDASNIRTGDWNSLLIRFFFYYNSTSNYWEDCQNFWDRTQDSFTFSDTAGTSTELDKGLEVKVTANSSNVIDTLIKQGNQNQTSIIVTADMGGNMTNVFICKENIGDTVRLYMSPYNCSGIGRLTNYNNFTITDAGNNITYIEEATADTETANMTAMFISNITNQTKGYMYFVFPSGTFKMDIFNASNNATITNWHVHFTNGTNTYTYTDASNTLSLSTSNLPYDSNMTIWKAGYENSTYNISNKDNDDVYFERHLITNDSFINIGLPENNSIFAASSTITFNLSLGNYADGNVSMWYSINDIAPYISVCDNCSIGSKSITLTSGTYNITVIFNNSAHYLGANNYKKIINVIVRTGSYNISFFDEMTNKSINFSDNKNGTLRVVCSDRDTPISVTGTLHEYTINCTGELQYLEFTLFDVNGNHYRTLIPTIEEGNLTFYMINTSNPVTSIVKVTFLIVDASMIYREGKMSFKKVILGEGEKDIIDQDLSAVDTVEAHLIVGESYTIYVESANGLNSKTVGIYNAKSSETSRTIIVTDLAFIPVHTYIGTDISWEMQFNTSQGKIYFYWNDTTNGTTRIKFWIYNATDISSKVQVYYDTVSDKSNHLFQWTYTEENDTYVGYFEITHTTFGNITGSRTLSRYQIFRGWLGDISIEWYVYTAIALLVFTACIFGAMHAPAGAVVLAIEAGIFFMIGWLPTSWGFSYLIVMFLIVIALLSKFSKRGEKKV